MALAQYGTLITTIGLAQIANAQITQIKVGLEYIALGDGNGAHYVPTQNQTALVREVWRGPIAELSIDPTNNNRIIVDAVIPVTAGGFTIREIGIFDDKNQLIAIGQYPEKYKPQLSEGVSEETLIHFVIETNNADVVKLNIDPTVIIASRKYVDEKVAGVNKNLTNVQQELTTHLDEDDRHLETGERVKWNGLIENSGFGKVLMTSILDWANTQTQNSRILVSTAHSPVDRPTGGDAFIEVIVGSAIRKTVTWTTYKIGTHQTTYTRSLAENKWFGEWSMSISNLYVQVGYKLVYVNYLTGSDTNDGSTKEKAFKTVNGALGASRLHGNRLDVVIAGGHGQTHPYFADFNNKFGSSINVYTDGVTPKPMFSGINVTSVDRFVMKNIDIESQLNIENCQDFFIQSVNKTSSNGSHVCKVIRSKGTFDNCLFSNGHTGESAGLHAIENSLIYLFYAQGGGNAIGILCDGSLIRKGAGVNIGGTIPTKLLNGGQII